jgi:hypothetical protein
MESATLKQCYPLWKLEMLGFIVPALLAITVFIATCFNINNNDPVGIAIALISSGVMAVLLTAAFFVQWLARKSLLDSVFIFKDMCPDKTFLPLPLAVRSEGIEDKTLIAYFERLLSNGRFITDGVINKLNQHVGINYGALRPLTIVTVKPIGKVFFTTLHGLVMRARGMQYGRWIQIEWYPENKERTKDLLIHELAHLFISSANFKMSEEAQHAIMLTSGIY